MSRKGRKPLPGAHRRPSGRPSEAKGARPDRDDGLVAAQPHRAPFAKLLGDGAARSSLAETALGRLRLIGQAEDRFGIEYVRRMMFGARPKSGLSNGIGEADYMAAQKYAEAVGRERWVRAAPKDKPSAIAFMTARGIDLNPRELSDKQARYYIEQFEESRAALMAAPLADDAQRVLRQLRGYIDRLRKGPVANEAGDILRLLRGFGPLNSPTRAAAIKRAVDLIVIDDRDPDGDALALARLGFKALVGLHFGDEKNAQARIRSFGEKPKDWSVAKATPTETGSGWKGRHRSLAS